MKINIMQEAHDEIIRKGELKTLRRVLMRKDLVPKTFSQQLARLNEECAEVIKAVSKYQRFGATATDGATGITYNNLEDIKSELSDLRHAMENISWPENREANK